MSGDGKAVWLNAFFSKGNDWDLEKILGSGYPAELQLHLENMLQPILQHRMPFVLPRIDENKQLSFYLLAEDKRQLTEVVGVMRAYLGAVRTKLDPQIHTRPRDAIESVLVDQFPQGFSKLSLPISLNMQKAEVYSVFGTINVARERYSERPASITVIQRPIGQVLSDFFVACDRRDGRVANEILEEVRRSGQMSARNLLSIELQALAAGCEWKRLLSHSRLTDILSGRIPAGVADVLFDALEQTVIRSGSAFEHDSGLLGGQLDTWRALFLRTPDLSPHGDTGRWKVWAIGAVALGYSRVIEALPRDLVGHEWIDDLTRWGRVQPTTERSESSFDVALSGPPSIDSAAILLRQALELNQREGLDIYRRLSGYPAEVLKEVDIHSGLRAVWRSLKEDFGAQKDVDSWSAWLESLIRGDADTMSLQTVSEACRHWGKDNWNEHRLTEQLFALADGDNSLIFRGVLPVLRKWLQTNNIRTSALFTEQLVLILGVDDSRSTQDLALIADLIGDITSVPHTKEQYRDAVGNAVEIWGRVGSVNSLGEGLEVMDVLLDSVCADSQARLNYWTALQEFCLNSWRRLTDEQQLLVLRTSEDSIGSSDHFPPRRPPRESTSPAQADLGNKRLAIYTLTEGAGRRAKAVLSELFPELEIHLNHDTSATNALVNLAATADFFIFASRSASHQAFYPVTQRRNDILYPTGKGTSSIVRCFVDSINA